MSEKLAETGGKKQRAYWSFQSWNVAINCRLYFVNFRSLKLFYPPLSGIHTQTLLRTSPAPPILHLQPSLNYRGKTCAQRLYSFRRTCVYTSEWISKIMHAYRSRFEISIYVYGIKSVSDWACSHCSWWNFAAAGTDNASIRGIDGFTVVNADDIMPLDIFDQWPCDRTNINMCAYLVRGTTTHRERAVDIRVTTIVVVIVLICFNIVLTHLLPIYGTTISVTYGGLYIRTVSWDRNPQGRLNLMVR